MHLKALKSTNFKNLKSQNYIFSDKLNGIVGNNGVGKTNLLDAIHYLALGKSYLNFKDKQNILFEEDFFLLEGDFLFEEKEQKIQLLVRKEQAKTIKKNGKTYEKIADHVGQFPLVMISPYDKNLISEGSDMRRKFLDNVISQSDTLYLKSLVDYNRLLSQRNALLKYFLVNRTFNQDTLSAIDSGMIPLAEKIFEKRKFFMEIFTPAFLKFYEKISQNEEPVSIQYESQLFQDKLKECFRENLQKDRQAGHSTQGIHKDDLVFKIFNHPIKKFGSQGQQKSFLIALKLAQLEFLKQQTHKHPILLLDDIFDKLDDQRVAYLIELVNNTNFGQIFITDTHPERTEKTLKSINNQCQMIHL